MLILQVSSSVQKAMRPTIRFAAVAPVTVTVLVPAAVVGGTSVPSSRTYSQLTGMGAGWVGVVGAPVMAKPWTEFVAAGSRIG